MERLASLLVGWGFMEVLGHPLRYDASAISPNRNAMRCIACGSQSELCVSYPAVWATKMLAEAVGRDAPEIALADYDLSKCVACGLEQANPMLDPPAAFYEWMNEGESLYHLARWEWHELTRHLHDDDRTILDIGCGSGAFLRYMRDAGRDAFGLELSTKAVEEARRDGLNVICGNFESAKHEIRQADVITMWHVVEHVADPVGMLENAASMLAPGGRIFFSVPVSPMSSELAWFDPFNHPPHHLTRWTPQSVLALADRLGMAAEIHMPAPDPLITRWARSLILQAVGPYSRLSPWKKAVRLLAHIANNPIGSLRELRLHYGRPRYEGIALPDVMMIELRVRPQLSGPRS